MRGSQSSGWRQLRQAVLVTDSEEEVQLSCWNIYWMACCRVEQEGVEELVDLV
jgi:hypothetical protein